MNPTHYSKFLLAVAFTLISGVGAALADGLLTIDEGLNLAIAGLTAIVTYVVPNLPSGPGAYLKLIVQAVGAGLVLATSLITDGVTMGEWFQIGAAVLGVFTVYAIPNFPEVKAVTTAGNKIYQAETNNVG